MMPFAYSNIDPRLSVDIAGLQGMIPVAGSKWRKNSTGGFSPATRPVGSCGALVSYWLSKRAQGTVIDSPRQFVWPDGRHRYIFSIAQSAYMMETTHAFLLDIFGLRITATRRWFRRGNMMATTMPCYAALVACTRPALSYLAVYGLQRSHALGVATTQPLQLFDPQEGVFTFASLTDMRIWIPLYIADRYAEYDSSVFLLEVAQ